MQAKKIETLLKDSPYPGRGIIMGSTPDGVHAGIAYFIMGRSDNSRNRVFEENGSGLRAKAFDESKVTDPSLIIYNPVKVMGDSIIVTNGDQTDQIARLMGREQLTFQQALQFIAFEPDKPYYTPRISAVMNLCSDGLGFRYQLSIAKTANGNPDSCNRFLYTYEPLAGLGHFIHTYGDDDKNLPSFSGEPVAVEMPNDIDGFTEGVWNALNAANKVSLFTRFVEVKTGNVQSRIVNKNKFEKGEYQ